MKGGTITSINELNLEEITFENMHWQYGTLLSHSVGKGLKSKPTITTVLRRLLESLRKVYGINWRN